MESTPVFSGLWPSMAAYLLTIGLDLRSSWILAIISFSFFKVCDSVHIAVSIFLISASISASDWNPSFFFMSLRLRAHGRLDLLDLRIDLRLRLEPKLLLHVVELLTLRTLFLVLVRDGILDR